MNRYKNKVEESFGELWRFVLDLQYETGKIKKAVLTGEKGDLKMPEEIPSEQTDNEYLKEQFGMLMKLYVFTKKDIDRFLIECNFTPDEERLFRLRCQECTLEYCAEQMNVSISTAKRLSRRVNNKIIKVC